jgi:hypothetical protein
VSSKWFLSLKIPHQNPVCTSHPPLCATVPHLILLDTVTQKVWLRNTYYLSPHYVVSLGPGSVVGIATAYGLDGQGIESRWGQPIPKQLQATFLPQFEQPHITHIKDLAKLWLCIS